MNPKSALNIKQQVFNITAALYKVTERLSVDEPLRNRLRERGIELMMIVQDVFSGKTINSDIHAILRQEIDNICFLLEFGRFCTSINPANFSVLVQSYQSLWRVIDNIIKISLESSSEESLQKLLSGINDPIGAKIKSPQKVLPESDMGAQGVKKETNNTTIGQEKSEMVEEKTSKQNNISDKKFFGKQLVRQQKIISILEEKSLDEFQLKDVLNEFPNFNEKTVRNDLKVLCESGILKRNGAGRSSVYKSNSANFK